MTGWRRIVLFGAHAEQALRAYLPARAELSARARKPPRGEPLLLNHRGGRLTTRGLGF